MRTNTYRLPKLPMSRSDKVQKYPSALLGAFVVAAVIVTSISFSGLQNLQFLYGSACQQTASVIDDGDCGHRWNLTGKWKLSPAAQGFMNDQYFVKPQPQVSDSISIWKFSNLTPGAYEVFVTWDVSSENVAVATNAPFTVRDGTTVLGTVRINQKIGTNVPESETYDGRKWVRIGLYDISSGSLQVNLRNKANGPVIADAVRIQKLKQAAALPSLAESVIVWAGKTGAKAPSFTDEQIQGIANFTDIMAFAGSHGQYNEDIIFADAKRLLAIKPDMTIFRYLSMTIVHKSLLDDYKADGFKDEWYLRASHGPKEKQILTLSSAHPEHYYINIAHPDYQDWLMTRIGRMYDTVDIAGVNFDNSNKKGVSCPNKCSGVWQGREYFMQHLTEDKIDTLDAAIDTILTRTKNEFPSKTVMVNGIAYRKWREGGRNLPLARQAEYTLNEDFCAYVIPRKDTVTKITTYELVYLDTEITLQDLEIAKNEHMKQLLQTNFLDPTNPVKQASVQNYCFGLFMAAYQPGRTYFGLGRYDIAQALTRPRGYDAPYGEPMEDAVFDAANSILSRSYEKGRLYVNISDSSQTVPIPFAGTIGAVLSSDVTLLVPQGDLLTIPARTSYFIFQE